MRAPVDVERRRRAPPQAAARAHLQLQLARRTWWAEYLYKFLLMILPVIFQIFGFTFLILPPTVFPKTFLNKFLTLFLAVAPMTEKTMGSGAPSSRSSPTVPRRSRTIRSPSRAVVLHRPHLYRQPRRPAGLAGQNLKTIIDYFFQVLFYLALRWPRHVAGECRCPRHTSAVLPGTLSLTRRSREWRPKI